MVSLTSLWLPILVSAVAVFLVSFVTHMVLRYHESDFARLPGEEEIMAVVGRHNVPPGDYMFPFPDKPNAMNDPAFMEKRNRGPAAIVSVMPSPAQSLGKHLFQWFIYSLVVSLFAAYLGGRALGPGARLAEVFRFTMTVGFLGYGLAMVHESIWFNRKWSSTWKNLFDAVLYGATTAAVFVWLWPRG